MDIFNVFDTFYDLLEYLVVLVISLAVVFFLWGMAMFVLKADDETERAKGKQRMIWGLITLFVMVSVWGVVNFLQDAFFSDPDDLSPGWHIPPM